jgi:hypothetical protein
LTETLRRWLLHPETTSDDVAGAALSGALIFLLFRFVFGDSWAFAAGAGAVVAVASFVLGRWLRSRRGRDPV